MTPAQMRKRYEAGQTVGEIAQACGLKGPVVRRHLVAAGATIRPRGFPVGKYHGLLPHKAEILRARRRGVTLQAIGDRHGVTRSRIHQVLKDWAA